MSFELELPAKEELEKAAAAAAGVIGAVIVLKLTTRIIRTAKMHHQNRQIKAMKNKIKLLEARVSELEKKQTVG